MRHQTISFIKSGFRILGYMMIPWSLGAASIMLVFSEMIGIWEEIGHE